MDQYSEEETAVRLLYVEDDNGTQEMVFTMLSANFPELSVELAQNGEEGLSLFERHHFDIVITDIGMPHKNGIQMAREIKALDREVQIILLTAVSDKDSIWDALESEINHYVVKPIEMGKFVDAIRRSIEQIMSRREWLRQEEFIRRRAHFDALTGLPNRLLFNERLHQALAQAQRQGWHLAILYLDLDHFKAVNDTLGHAVGDQMLQAVANRLKECCRREQDVVSRHGGDEFILLLSDPDTAHEAARLAQKIVDAFAAPIVLPGCELFVTPSIGISLFPDDGTGAEDLIRNADIAMYSTKAEGRNGYRWYNFSMNEQSQRRVALERGLRDALQKQELFLQYQPKVDVATGRVSGIEALLRWRHPELGLVAPQEFLPVAEQSGLIGPISEWVLRTACAQNKGWQKAQYPPLRVAVNVSSRQFQKGEFADMVQGILAQTELEACWLELEVSEGVKPQEVEEIRAAMERLSDLGVQITIDNFGKEAISLPGLRKLPIRSVKIDRSFLTDLTGKAEDGGIVLAAIAVARSLGLDIIAGGVEAREQLDFLYDHDCPQMQGFLFSEPLLAADVPQLFVHPSWGGWSPPVLQAES